MQTVAWSALLIFACWYRVSDTALVPVTPGFDAQRFAGRWYPIRLVMDPPGEMKEPATVGRMAIVKPNGDIDMDAKTLENGKCVTKITTLLHTDYPGIFKTEGSTIHVVETDYETFHILYVETNLYKVLQLEVRDQGSYEYGMKRFKHLTSSFGFSEDKVIEVPQTGSCVK